MNVRYALVVLLLATISVGCRNNLSKYPGYVDPSHVRIFGKEGQSWEGLDVTETPDGRYVVVGEATIYENTDAAGTAIAISVSENGDSLWLYRNPLYSTATSVESLKDGKIAMEDWGGIQIVDKDGRPLYRLHVGSASYSQGDIFSNDAIIYDPRIDAVISFYPGVCLKQLPVDGSSGWLTCSGLGGFGTEIALTENGYVALAERVGGLLLFAVDTQGTLLWVDTLRIPREYTSPDIRSSLRGLALTDDGGFMIAGQTWLSEGWYPYIIKLDSNRKVEWIKKYDRPGDEIERWDGYPMDLLKLHDGTYVMIGMNRACPGGYCGAMMRIDEDGNVLRARNYFMWSGDMAFWNGIVASDGNIVVTGGTTNSADKTGTYYVFIFKFTPDGDPVW